MTKYEGYPNSDPFRRYFNKNYWERPSTNLFMTCDNAMYYNEISLQCSMSLE